MEFHPPKPEVIYSALHNSTQQSTDAHHIRIYMETHTKEEIVSSAKEKIKRAYQHYTIQMSRETHRYAHPLFISFYMTPLRLHPHTHSLTYGASSSLRPHERSRYDEIKLDEDERAFYTIGTLNIRDDLSMDTPSNQLSDIHEVAISLKEFISSTRTSSAV